MTNLTTTKIPATLKTKATTTCSGRLQTFVRRPALVLLLFLAATSSGSPSSSSKVAAFSVDSQKRRVFVSTPAPTHPERTVGDCMTDANDLPVVLRPNQSTDVAMVSMLRSGAAAAAVVHPTDVVASPPSSSDSDPDSDSDSDSPSPGSPLGGRKWSGVVGGGGGPYHRLVGIVTPYDFLPREAHGGALLPLDPSPGAGGPRAAGTYGRAARKIAGATVGDVMTSVLEGAAGNSATGGTGEGGTPSPGGDGKVTTASVGQGMREVAARMARDRVHCLPVVTDGGYFVGMVTSQDVMRDLLNLVRELPPTPAAGDDRKDEGPALGP